MPLGKQSCVPRFQTRAQHDYTNLLRRPYYGVQWLSHVLCCAAGEQGSQHQRIVAVDCEMCYTRNALELTRVTLVNENEQVCSEQLHV